jgi:hypothetical protein
LVATVGVKKSNSLRHVYIEKAWEETEEVNESSNVADFLKRRKVKVVVDSGQEMEEMMTKEHSQRQLVEKAYNYPLLQALIQRRSRRFGLGCEIEHGPLKYKSSKDSVPLSLLETALLCYAGAGSTGLALGDIDTTHGSNTLMHWSSRSFPSPCNNHQTQLLFTDDNGVYLYKPTEAIKVVDIETLDDLLERVQGFNREVIRLKDYRLDIPDGPPALLMLNKSTVNRPGQMVFMPVVHPTYELINMALTCFQYEHWNFVDDDTRKPAGTEKWVSKLKLGLKVPISIIEKNILVTCALEAGLACQNILLMAQALGLGAFPLGGYTPIVVMGGTPVTRGLGFRFVPDKSGFPNPVGIDGFLEGYCPPYMSIDEAVEAVVKQKFGPAGIFTPEAEPTPYLDQKTISKGMEPILEDVVQCTKDFCNYVYEKYGKLPGTVDSMSLPMWVVAQHLDLDFYERFYPPAAITQNQRTHMREWHSAL